MGDHYDEQREADAEQEHARQDIMNSPEYRAKHALKSMKATMDCPFCAGEGVVYDPKSQRDCVEGNKMRPLITCNACEGEGKFNRDSARGKASIAYWQTFMIERDKEKAVERKLKATRERLFDSIYGKLTDEELALIDMERPEGT